MSTKQIQDKIRKIYTERNKAHDKLLKCDIELDKLLKQLLNTNDDK